MHEDSLSAVADSLSANSKAGLYGLFVAGTMIAFFIVETKYDQYLSLAVLVTILTAVTTLFCHLVAEAARRGRVKFFWSLLLSALSSFFLAGPLVAIAIPSALLLAGVFVSTGRVWGVLLGLSALVWVAAGFTFFRCHFGIFRSLQTLRVVRAEATSD